MDSVIGALQSLRCLRLFVTSVRDPGPRRLSPFEHGLPSRRSPGQTEEGVGRPVDDRRHTVPVAVPPAHRCPTRGEHAGGRARPESTTPPGAHVLNCTDPRRRLPHRGWVGSRIVVARGGVGEINCGTVLANANIQRGDMHVCNTEHHECCRGGRPERWAAHAHATTFPLRPRPRPSLRRRRRQRSVWSGR